MLQVYLSFLGDDGAFGNTIVGFRLNLGNDIPMIVSLNDDTILALLFLH